MRLNNKIVNAMKKLQKTISVLTNLQILSALIWAAVIIACKQVSGNNDISNILIPAAGIHVILMSHFFNRKSKTVAS